MLGSWEAFFRQLQNILQIGRPPSFSLVSGGMGACSLCTLLLCFLPVTPHGAHSQYLRGLIHAYIRHTMTRFGQIQGRNAVTCLFSVQGTLNKKARYCARYHPVGIPLVLWMRTLRLSKAVISRVWQNRIRSRCHWLRSPWSGPPPHFPAWDWHLAAVCSIWSGLLDISPLCGWLSSGS